jgi:hypothetical protein
LRKHLVNGIIATLYIYNAPKHLQRLTNNVGLTFSVGDTTELKYVSVEGDWKAENLDFLG